VDSKHSEKFISESGGAVRFSGFSLAQVPGSVLDLNPTDANHAVSRDPNAGAPPIGVLLKRLVWLPQTATTRLQKAQNGRACVGRLQWLSPRPDSRGSSRLSDCPIQRLPELTPAANGNAEVLSSICVT
jgi:hypothetical protein